MNGFLRAGTALSIRSPFTLHTNALLSERGRPRPPPSNRTPGDFNGRPTQNPSPLPTSVRRGRPRTAALRQKSVRVLGKGTSVRRRRGHFGTTGIPPAIKWLCSSIELSESLV